MFSRLGCTLVFGLCLVTATSAQTVRFDTNVGNIDLVLNPTGNTDLQGHVDNMLAYVEAGRYENTVLNRADNGSNPDDPSDDFVLQFGGFLTNTRSLPSSFNDFPAVQAFDPVIVDLDGDGNVDFNREDLTNTRGTVTLALSNGPNTGTSSFFVSLGDNSFLDANGFVPFAVVQDMSTVDFILRLNQAALGTDLTTGNIPVLEDNQLVFVERAFVLDPNPVALSLANDSSDTVLSEVQLPTPPPAAAFSAMAIPEPQTLLLALAGFLGAVAASRRRLS